ncbi:methylmalonyl Co-A mutase-associated GTPase MeaB [Varunaivibrio sulfuroxidans]|uniref:LAO/AO transport system kinase n=1 Tax=Varunaivibrio sulfuroxidans TaxID=1773489 RepID=A0A4R3JEW0_9PROT|nr:methylmalonyl Co-A mutase-associated GTPase MeaB [Varunaivibrio sulfuroxidans]TCS64337.1 LAO/AO transport system kinase [Varunaivibrio sulfuroxidans]WES31225.1 methylmalonyl Co-A mutase-associated GTPase MeaB [Varunaivibrio sulfuroxidans]
MTDNTIAGLSAGIGAGDPRAIARAMSLIEGRTAAAAALMGEVQKHTGRAHIVGLTGVPGSGKSTMVASLTRLLRSQNVRVGIIAIDPSSPFSGGAILGDRVRMSGFSGDDGVFIRSMATRGALGGLARASLDTVDILDAAGYDVVLIETVGVGQDEVDIVQAAHTVVVVSAPGLGDDIQAIKAGVLEIADIHVVSKCDRPGWERTVAELKAMMSLGRYAQGPSAWRAPVIPTSAETGQGMDELCRTLDAHRRALEKSGELAARKRAIIEMRIVKSIEDQIRARIAATREGGLKEMVERVENHEIDIHGAAVMILDHLGESV